MSLKRGGYVFTCDFCDGQTETQTDDLPPGWGTVKVFVPMFDRSPDRRDGQRYHQRYGETHNKHVCNNCVDHETIAITIVRGKQLSIAQERGKFIGNLVQPGKVN